MASAEQIRNALEERFARLEADALAPGAIQTIDLPLAVAGAAVLLGRDDEGTHLLVPLEPDAHRRFKEDRRSGAVHLRVRGLEIAGALHWYADLACVQRQLHHVFVSLLADAVARLDLGEDGGERTLRRCLADWRALLTSGERILTTRQLAGLFGELTVVLRCLDIHHGAAARWVGPLKRPHDFEGGAVAVEVKTSLADDGSVIRVNGLGQLAAPGDGELLLRHLRVVEASYDALTVVDLVEQALARVEDPTFQTRLHAAGYRAAHEAAYRRIGFETLEQSWYRVDASFPRIVDASFPGGVPSAIVDVDYTLDLSFAAASLVDDHVGNAHLEALVEAG